MSTTRPRLLIVIVNYNGFDLTRDCLESVADQIHEVPGARVGLCDNGSRPGTPDAPGDAERLKQLILERGWQVWCELTVVDPNLGFTGGNNAVIEPYLASPDTTPTYTLLLNNDTLLREGSLRTLVGFMDDRPDVGLAGARLEDPDGTPQVAAFHFNSPTRELEAVATNGLVSRLLRSHQRIEPIPEQPTRVGWVAGASLIIRDTVLREVGPLDSEYYTYFDDIDYCQAAAAAGHETWYVPEARIVHLVGQTTGVTEANSATTTRPKRPKRRGAYWFEARRRYWLKHHGRFGAVRADLAQLAGVAVSRLWRPQIHPDRFWRDCWSQSVFRRGFKLPRVQNPALAAGAANRPPHAEAVQRVLTVD